jgi:hypothetical protein
VVQAAVLQKDLLEHGHYDAIHVRAGGSTIHIHGMQGKLSAVSYSDKKISQIPQAWIEAFRVRERKRGGL